MMSVPSTHSLPLGSFVRYAVAALVVFALFVGSHAEGKGGKGHKKSSADEKKRTIDSLKHQIEVARAVLSAAEAHGQLSKSDLDFARRRLTNARIAIDAADVEERQALRAQRQVEDEILDALPEDSPVVRAQAKVDQAREALDRAVNRAESASPGAKDADLAEADRDGALENLKNTARELAKLKHDLFVNDSRWQAANRAVVAAREKETQAKNDSDGAALPTLPARHQFRDAASVAAAARATIAAGEAKLRALGVDPNPKSKAKSSPPKPKK
jgi:hypothetical protein